MPELHYSCSGDGAPLLILHGLFGSARNWQSHARRFAEHFEVYSIDLRNHGQSFHAEPMNYEVMAADLAQLLQRLGLEHCSVLGHSMGGKVAMTLAAHYPRLVARLLVADIAPVAYRHHYDDLIEPILALDLSRYTSRNAIDHALRGHIQQDQLRAFLLHNLVRVEDGWGWRVNWRAIQQDMDELTGFDSFADDWVSDLPALFVRGANSDYVGAAEIEVIRRHFSNAEIATIESAGHWLHAEKPEEFTALALQFLRED